MPGHLRLSDLQRLLVVLTVAAALFLVAMSAGMRNLNLLLVGVGMIVALGVGRLLLGMRRGSARPIHASAYVITVRPPRAGAIVDRCHMRLMVEMPGRPSTMTQHSEALVPVSKWPRVGSILPVEIAAANPRHLRVRWDLVDTAPAPGGTAPETVAAAPGDTAPVRAASAPVTVPPTRTHALALPAPAVPVSAPPGPDEYADVDDLLTDLDELLGVADVDPAETGPQPAVGIMLAVTDLDRSLWFYADRLGFGLVDRSAGGAVLTHGSGLILLREVSDVSMMERRAMHIHIQVDDLESRYQQLRARGIDFVHSPRLLDRGDRLELYAATFRDPDGHVIALTEWRTL